jgi:hypothetical protein
MFKRVAVGVLTGAVAGLAGSQAAFRTFLVPMMVPSALAWPGWVGSALGGGLLGGISASFASTTTGGAVVGGFAGLGGGFLGGGIGGRIMNVSAT